MRIHYADLCKSFAFKFLHFGWKRAIILVSRVLLCGSFSNICDSTSGTTNARNLSEFSHFANAQHFFCPKRCTEKIILFTSSYVEKSTNRNKARHQLEWTPIQWCLTARIVGISSDIKLICLRINFVRIKIYLKLIWWNLNHRYDWLQSSIFFINVWKSDEN